MSLLQACVLTLSLGSSDVPTFILSKLYTSLHIKQPDSGIFCDKRKTKGMMGNTEGEAKKPTL